MKKRAIIFDDDKGIRDVLKRILELRGYDVITFIDPTESLLLHSHDCHCSTGEFCAHIIMTDIDMPEVSGLKFIQGQKKKGCKVQNIAVMSGAWTDADMRYAEELGCKVIQKPFTVSEIKRWLDACEKRSLEDHHLSDWFLEQPEDEDNQKN